MSAGRARGAMRTVDWDGADVLIIDQTLLPHEERILRLHDVDQLAEAIARMRVRGAMALGVAGALGLALAVRRAQERGAEVDGAVDEAAATLLATRPTAVNLRWGIEQVRALLPRGPEELVAGAQALLERDVVTNRALSQRGADLLLSLRAERAPLRLLTHCNAGALAGVAWGSALGIVQALEERQSIELVLTPETRPLLQGSRLTSWELERMGVDYRVIADSAAASLIAAGRVDAVVVGADRIAANGDVANKIGTYSHAVAAHYAGTPFVVAAPESTIDPSTTSGADIPIEQRPGRELLELDGRRIAPASARALNPAFDVTPAELVTAIVTEERVIRPPGERPVARPA